MNFTQRSKITSTIVNDIKRQERQGCENRRQQEISWHYKCRDWRWCDSL